MKHKKAIEVVVMGSALAVTVGSAVLPMAAHAAVVTACSYSSTGQGATITGGPSEFVKVEFRAKCSPNTLVEANDVGNAFMIKGGSKKGNVVYGATSEGGGGVQWCNSPSTYADAAAQVGAAPTNSLNPCQ